MWKDFLKDLNVFEVTHVTSPYDANSKLEMNYEYPVAQSKYAQVYYI